MDLHTRRYPRLRRDCAGDSRSRVVFHLAAIPSVPRSIDEPVPSHEVEYRRHLQRVSRRGGGRRAARGVCRVVVGLWRYGGAAESGDDDAAAEIALCGCRSSWANIMAAYSSSCFGLETVSLRFFNVYGPRQDPSSPYSGVLSIFMTALLDAAAADHFRRRRTVARFHLRGGCGRR